MTPSDIFGRDVHITWLCVNSVYIRTNVEVIVVFINGSTVIHCFTEHYWWTQIVEVTMNSINVVWRTIIVIILNIGSTIWMNQTVGQTATICILKSNHCPLVVEKSYETVMLQSTWSNQSPLIVKKAFETVIIESNNCSSEVEMA